MAQDKHLKDFAKKLVAMSLDADGQASSERVSAVLEALAQEPPRQYKQLLKQYAKYLEIEVARGTAKVEFAGPMPAGELAKIEQQFTQQYNRKIVATTKENPKLIAGIRVTVGDDVFDASVATRLAQLEQNVT
ncbi:F0F1 ATP synthase subunit delta [Cerasicoccus fimbriatus]|uniref:F0F1 ATP synthase subunit delta n=1 Tax=Cerasicoccus fimbriatus TaxID=3014554 RepID=UPI0022B33AC9|nr:F0F1 ATP synthase subunit delta [Cerasicoccus sp. TK19100]